MPDIRAYRSEHTRGLKERFRKGRLDGFSSGDALELVLSYAVAKGDVREHEAALLERFKDLRGVLDASVEDLSGALPRCDGAVLFIRLLKEAAGAYLKARMMGKDVLRNPREMLDYLDLTLSGERVEKFLAIYLNRSNEVIAVEILHEGTINQTVVYPRKVIEKAFAHKAHAVIFVHNHPSGDCNPSALDRELTAVLERASRAVDLIVHDHVIIGRKRHFSSRENGLLRFPSRAGD